MRQIAAGVCRLPISFVNVYLVGNPGGPWVLVDTGLPGRSRQIRAAAERRFGVGGRPEAILLTHGHFDHSGSERELADIWDVQIYVHRLEVPFLTGKSLYPPTDPTVGGAISFLSRFFPPNGMAALGSRVAELPTDESVPGLPDWKWYPTPGHSPGHISLFREEDKTLIAGDALATVNMDSFPALLTGRQKLNRPPSPVTCDWVAARRSLACLAGLEPFTIACGHGVPMAGPGLAKELELLAEEFEIPRHGRYVSEPARTNEQGIVELPPPASDPMKTMALGIGVAALAGCALAVAARSNRGAGGGD